jgi:hypothetical protein
MRRAVRLPCSLAPLVVQARWQSTGDKASTLTSEEAKPPKPDSTVAPAEAPKAPSPATDSSARSSEQGGYHFPTNEVIDAVKKRDFNAVQTHASRLVQSQWKEVYNVPAACIVVFVVMWYWIAWSRRSIRRKCEALKASTKQQTEEMVEVVRGMTEKWKTDMAKANQQMQGIIDKNSELTRDIDRMTTALRSCSIRPTPASSVMSAPTVTVVKRAPVVTEMEEAPAEVPEAAEVAASPEKTDAKE